MYYKPQHFVAEELFPESVVQLHKRKNMMSQIWRLMDGKTLWTIDRLRKLHGTIVVNDYLWGGYLDDRGYRPAIELIDWNAYTLEKKIKASFSSFTSQHCFGRAIDGNFKNVSSEEVRQDIKMKPNREAYKFITAVEEKISWFHFDTRCWDTTKSGILFFKP